MKEELYVFPTNMECTVAHEGEDKLQRVKS
jgi:hypothetical protein